VPRVQREETPASGLAELERRLRVIEGIAARAPDTTLAWELANQFVAVTSGTFVPTAHVELPVFYGEVLNLRLVVATDASTTGEVRLRQEISGATTSAAVLSVGGVQKFVNFEWLHGVHLGDTYEHFMVEARRTGGAGNVNVYYPRRSILSTPLRFPTANSTGNPTVF
jgi:hypothetical protein